MPHRRSCGLHGYVLGSAPTGHVAEKQPRGTGAGRALPARRSEAGRRGSARGDTGGLLARGAARPAGMAGCPGLTHTLTAAARPAPQHRASSWGAAGRGQDAACGLSLWAGPAGRRHRETTGGHGAEARNAQESHAPGARRMRTRDSAKRRRELQSGARRPHPRGDAENRWQRCQKQH